MLKQRFNNISFIKSFDRNDEQISKISLGFNNTCAITSMNNKVVCWGSNSSFGIVNYLKSNNMNQKQAIDIAAGHSHNCIINMQRKVECLGNNTFNQTNVPQGTQLMVDRVYAGW